MNLYLDSVSKLSNFYETNKSIPKEEDLAAISRSIYERYHSFCDLSQITDIVYTQFNIMQLQAAMVAAKIVEIEDAAVEEPAETDDDKLGEVEPVSDPTWTQKDIVKTSSHLQLSDIAQIAYEINLDYCAELGEPIPEPWVTAGHAQRESVLNGVLFTLNNPQATPVDNHANWMQEKTKQGWSYGPVKDAEKKEHPLFAPYSELPPEHQMKNMLFQAIVRNLLKFVVLDHEHPAE